METKREIRDFLMSRRSRVTPQMAGLPFAGGGDRRVPGLRREEVAMLAGVSVEYYTRMERGSLGGASESVLEAVVRVLQLDDDERAHLYDLARSAKASSRSRKTPRREPAVTDAVQQVLDSMSVPAVVMNARMDLIAANDLGRALYPGPFGMTGQPNFARFAFLDSRAADFYADFEGAKNFTVSVLRAAAGRDPLDTELSDLIGELAARSQDFSARWGKHNVHRHTQGRKTFHHPGVGTLDLVYTDLALPGDPTVSITAYTAAPDSPTADALALLGAWARTQQEEQGRAAAVEDARAQENARDD
ncbi:helix-turn-helix transcriptional regulator [Saccharopolyspora sp. 6T]|uniref:helix-turn-helix transcriptional regulator n=1 Tax=Saccharopolyspora sp. 6T TaxID=2877238 RepID=UPI001CD1E6E3|nr:helix-turn-helix transcriptional regulator [Saccharopolyspora sp. 6T]MCA1188496.1 helix-turn-helix transcriptional regulator [Saccharopolyspora sp. 6T]